LIATVAVAALFVAAAGLMQTSRDIPSSQEPMLTLINDYRSQRGLPALLGSAALTGAAQWMAEDLSAGARPLNHIDSLGRDPFARTAAFGYPGNTWQGENQVWGVSTPEAALAQWVASSGHNAILLAPQATEAGIGVAGEYWVLNVGSGAPVVTPAPVTPAEAPATEGPTPEPAPVCGG
jgi:uncharacterized protein YkwD